MLFRRRRDNPPVRFRLTKAGWAFLAACVVVGIVAVNSGLALLYVMFGCLLGALHVSAVLARRMIAAVRVQRDLPARCRQNQPVTLGYLLRSIRGGGTCLALRIEEAGVRGVEIPPAACGHLPAHQSFLSRTAMTPSRRGRIHLRALRLSTTFPFGLVSATRQFAQAASLRVWPARGRLTRPLLGRGEALSTSASPSFRAGGQEEFFGLREYRLGDNARWIHWRRSAGRGEPVIREMSRPRPKTLWVVLDTRLADGSAEAVERRERAIRFAATIFEDALAAGYRVGAAMAYRQQVVVLRPAERRAQRQVLLDALTDIDDHAPRPLGETVARLRPSWLHHTHVVVIGADGGEAPLPADALVRLRRDCRNLTIVSGPQIEAMFRDDPAAAQEVE